jgi:hypothetical protein
MTLPHEEGDHHDELWQIDQTELDTPVLSRTRGKRAKLWMTCLIDPVSRVVIGSAMSARPSEASVLEALPEAPTSGSVVDDGEADA